MEIIIARTVFCLVAAMAAVGLLFDLGLFSGIVKTVAPEEYWPVYSFMIICCLSNYFCGEPCMAMEIFAMQMAVAVMLAAVIRTGVLRGLWCKLFWGVTSLFYLIVLTITLYEYMGHADMTSPSIWLYSCIVLSLSAYSLCYRSFISSVSSLFQENIVRAVLRGTVSAGILLLALVSAPLVREADNIYVSMAVVLIMNLLIVYLFAVRLKRDEFLYLPNAGKAASVSLRTCLPQITANRKSPQPESELQKRFVAYFEDRKPYLNPELTMADVVNALYTNKTYLSRMLNDGMGMNFNQTVNKYRVIHSMELYMADPTLQISEMAEMSGFNSVSTFSLAFRLHAGLAPGDWCKSVRSGMAGHGKGPLICED